MARGKKSEKALTPEEKLAQALVPVEAQPYPVPGNWCWLYGESLFLPMEAKKPTGEIFRYIDIDSIDNKLQVVSAPKVLPMDKAPSRASRALHTGDTVFSMVRPYLKNIAYIDDSLSDAIASTGFYVCQPRNNINHRFIYYLMISPYVVDGLNSFMKGDNSPSIRKDDLLSFVYPVPPHSEQRRIVDRIESLFAKLDEAKEKAQAVVDSFETRKAAILHQAFTGNLIGKRDVTLVPLEKIVDEIRIGPFGSALHEEDYIVDGIPVINPKHISNQIIIPQSKVTVSIKKVLELQSYCLKVNDIVLGRRGEMGRAAPVTSKEDGWLCGTGSMIIRLKNKYQAKFYSLIISSQASIQYLERHAVGTTLKNLNEKIVRQLPIPDFTIVEQDKLFHTLDLLLSKEQQAKETAEAVIGRIDIMKKAILARAFRGELGTNDPADESAVELLKTVVSC